MQVQELILFEQTEGTEYKTWEYMKDSVLHCFFKYYRDYEYDFKGCLFFFFLLEEFYTYCDGQESQPYLNFQIPFFNWVNKFLVVRKIREKQQRQKKVKNNM